MELGCAVGLGVWIGCTPLWGLHLPLALALATLFGFNRLVAGLATNISIPPMIPLLTAGSVQLGSLILDGHTIPIDWDVIADIPPESLLWRWLVGGLAGGLVLGALLGAGTGVAVARLRRRRDRAPGSDPDAHGSYSRGDDESAP